MLNTIEAKEKALLHVFCNEYLFEIPSYQRPYSWTTEQAGDLLDDLQTAMGDEDDPLKSAPYFLGSIVLIKEPGSKRSDVVDGQQRLTTLTILFCVLRELADDPDAKSSLGNLVREKGDLFAGAKDQPRLSVRTRDRSSFESNIQREGGLASFIATDPALLRNSQSLFRENAELFWTRCGQLDVASRNRLAKFIVQRCFLVVVSASDQESAYRIFSVMNDRGIDLSPTDILKAYLIGSIEKPDRDDYTTKWEGIEAELGREKFRDLFAHIRMIYVRRKMKRSLSAEFRDEVFRISSGKPFINDVLVPMADAYGIVSEANYKSQSDAEKVNLSLRYLKQLDNVDWVHPAIAFYNANKTDRTTLIEFYRDLERLAYAMFLLRRNINARLARYADVLHAIEAGLALAGDSPLQLTNEERSEVRRQIDGQIYPLLRVRLPLLLRIDSMLTEGGVVHDRNVVTIEHVLPQSPAQGSEWADHFDENSQKFWTHRLANLVLLTRRINSQAGNQSLSKKKTQFFQKSGVTTFALTSQVLSEPTWTPEVLVRRQNYLVDRLAQEWRLD